MGLLERAIANNNTHLAGTSGEVNTNILIDLINDFANTNLVFHCIVFQGNAGEISAMMAGHHAVCAHLSGEKCLVLLPGSLDRELFAHRLSHSAKSAVLFQSGANSASFAIEILAPYLR
jgi:hypothetical protein